MKSLHFPLQLAENLRLPYKNKVFRKQNGEITSSYEHFWLHTPQQWWTAKYFLRISCEFRMAPVGRQKDREHMVMQLKKAASRFPPKRGASEGFGAAEDLEPEGFPASCALRPRKITGRGWEHSPCSFSTSTSSLAWQRCSQIVMHLPAERRLGHPALTASGPSLGPCPRLHA